jgi:hypothetical protein
LTRTIALAVAVTLAAPCAAASQQKQDCTSLVVPYEKRAEISSLEYSLELSTPGDGRLTYFGSAHSDDPADPMFAKIDAAWERARPTIAFYEGPDRPIFDDRDETIRRTGESGYVRFLAKKAGIPVARLEPSPKAQVDYLATKFTREQVELFFVLGEAARLRERKGLGEAEIRAAIGQLMERAAQMGLVGEITSVEKLEAAYARHWKSPEQWWQAPAAWFDPLKPSSETGGLFTNDVNRESSHYRDIHMVEALSKAAREGHRVFAVVGRDHVPQQAAALRCSLQ